MHSTSPSNKTQSTISKVRQLKAIAIVSAGYGGDMPDDIMNTILDSLDFDIRGNICCPALAEMMPILNQLVSMEMSTL